MKIIGLHIRDTKNVGDRWSSPLDYFGFDGCEVFVGDMRSPPKIDADLVIYGGGSIVTSPDFRSAKRVVAWGVGHHVRHPPWEDEMRSVHESAARSCELYFPRDPFGDSVPCASCMNRVFDFVPAPTVDVVRYSAARRIMVDEPSGSPHMTNEDGTIEEAVAFLASGRMVITSSYHGAYWARLMKREVKIVPWGSKFSYLPDMDLAACRGRNLSAYRSVLNLIKRVS